MAALHIAKLKTLTVEELIKKHDEVADNTNAEGITTVRDELRYREAARLTEQMRMLTFVMALLTAVITVLTGVLVWIEVQP
jgi:hypothetical protein